MFDGIPLIWTNLTHYEMKSYLREAADLERSAHSHTHTYTHSHAVSCGQVSVYKPLISKVFHSFGYLHTHWQQLTLGGNDLWVIPSHVNKSFDMTISELDETWYAGSTFGFVMPDKISVPFIVWFPG